MEGIFELIVRNQEWIILATVLFTLLLFVFIIVQGLIIRKWKKKYYNLMGGRDFNSLEEMLGTYNSQVSKILNTIEDIVQKQKYIDKKLDYSIHKVGMIRYNAFNDMGSDLSYSVAFLDGKDDGVVMSGIFGRDFCNTYSKPIAKGESDYKLTAEEILALDRAKRSID